MKWLIEWGMKILTMLAAIAALILVIVTISNPKTETVSDLPGVDITEYSVAGGGVQRVITFRGDGCTYEVVITEEP